MKTNLDTVFKTNKLSEKEGQWFDVTDEISFFMKRFGGTNSQSVKAAMAKHYKKYAKMVQAGTLPASKEQEILYKAFIESSMISWKGVEIDGELKDYSDDDCLKLFLELPDLADTLIDYASNFDSFKEDLGNS